MSRMPIPPKFANAPEVPIGTELYYNAFWDLTTCRPVSYGIVAPIPWTAIMDYAQAYDFSEEQLDDLLYTIKQMDKAYLNHKAEEAKRNQ